MSNPDALPSYCQSCGKPITIIVSDDLESKPLRSTWEGQGASTLTTRPPRRSPFSRVHHGHAHLAASALSSTPSSSITRVRGLAQDTQ